MMPDEPAALGKALRGLRERLGLSQEELAAFAGLSRTSLGEIERGETNPSFDTLCRLAAATRIPLSELIMNYEQHRS